MELIALFTTIRGKVRRITGSGGTINYKKGLRPDFRHAGGVAPVVGSEHFINIHTGQARTDVC